MSIIYLTKHTYILMGNRILNEEKTKNQNISSKAKQNKKNTHNFLYSVISSCKDLASFKHAHHFYNKN